MREELKSRCLTPQEIRVLKLLLNGVMPKEIANELNISRSTVKLHCANIYRKYDIPMGQGLRCQHLLIRKFGKFKLSVIWVPSEEHEKVFG